MLEYFSDSLMGSVDMIVVEDLHGCRFHGDFLKVQHLIRHLGRHLILTRSPYIPVELSRGSRVLFKPAFEVSFHELIIRQFRV